jgi:2-polyprenyl-6-methoxyphenol hydroxylase-like FAD-dependent oxidoreductase
MEAEADGLVFEEGSVVGVMAQTPDGPLTILSELVVGCDGRHSTVRREAGLEVQDFGVAVDVLWMRISKPDELADTALAYMGEADMMVLIHRGDYFQGAMLIPKGRFEELKTEGLEKFRNRIFAVAPFLAGTVDSIESWDDVKLLSVRIDRLKKWWRSGLLCIGDAAHAMSPVGGVGINLAVQDAVAAANILGSRLKGGRVDDLDLEKVQSRREWPTKVVQSVQQLLHKRLLGSDPAARLRGIRVLQFVATRVPFIRRVVARFLGFGPRSEHVRPEGGG